jgi:sulfate permease, SulP family
LRLGFVSSFLSRPVAVGFIFGLAANIVSKQLPKLFGVEAGDGSCFERLADLIRHLPDTQPATLLLGLAVLVVLVALEHAAPGSRRRWWPWCWPSPR